MFDNIEQSSADLAALKAGYENGGFTFKVNQEATAAQLLVNANVNIFKDYNNSKCVQFTLAEGSPYNTTITSPAFKVTPLSKYGLNFAVSLNSEGMTGTSRMDLVTKVYVYDSSDNLIATYGNGAGDTPFISTCPGKLAHGDTIWPPYTVPFSVPNNADHAIMELTIKCPTVAESTHAGYFRVHGMYVENQD
jgi:hypothetical protein